MGEWLLSKKWSERMARQSGERLTHRETIHINQASPQQVVALLRLTPGEAWEILRARPLRSVEALVKLLPEAHPETLASLELKRLPLNEAREIELIHLAGLSPSQAARICAGRPYVSEEALCGLASLSEVDRFRLLEIFSIPEARTSLSFTSEPGPPVFPGASSALPRQPRWA